MGGQQAAIGGDTIARFQQHDVAGHQQRGIQVDDPSIAAHPGRCGQHALQGRQRLFRPVLLIKPQSGVEHDDDEDNHCILEVANGPRQPGGKQQHDNQEVFELVDKFQPQRSRRGFQQPIFTHTRQPLGDLGFAQALCRNHRQRLRRGFTRQGVPGLGFSVHTEITTRC